MCVCVCVCVPLTAVLIIRASHMCVLITLTMLEVTSQFNHYIQCVYKYFTALITLCVSPTAVLMGTGLDLKEEWLWESPSHSTRHCRH